ncbi:MAG: carbohydrate porin [Verrucomicrobiota bacterium]
MLGIMPTQTLASDDNPTVKEWPGSGLKWAEWSRLTGIWAGLRTSAERAGFTFTGTHTLDWSSPVQGALDYRSTARGLFNLQAALALPTNGVTFIAQYLVFHGRDAGADLGTLVSYSNIDSAPFAHWAELSYQQVFFDGQLRLKFGQLDANTEFANVHAAAEFLHASAGYSPTIVGFRTYPDPALSANAFVKVNEWISAGVGLYGNTVRQTSIGLERPFAIGEIVFNQDVFGRIAVGFARENARLTRFDSTSQSGTGSFYAMAEQRIWQKNPGTKDDPRGVTLFEQLGTAAEAVSRIRRHVSVGLSGTGLLPDRDADICGLLCSVATTSHADPTLTAPNETAIEGYYGVHLTGFLTMKADFQFIRHPGGDAARHDAVVGTLRFVTTF